MMWEWLKWRPMGWSIGLGMAISWPDASRDVCLVKGCGVQRRFHVNEGHAFSEKHP